MHDQHFLRHSRVNDRVRDTGSGRHLNHHGSRPGKRKRWQLRPIVTVIDRIKLIHVALETDIEDTNYAIIVSYYLSSHHMLQDTELCAARLCFCYSAKTLCAQH